ncbi:hypothetical protein SAMN05216312_102204 [Cohnella sp. OV330]|uniref:hypothetical protein n=1 Tax=Cohnella sp. OV330 TaxID=1855288 RepID=UPI0008DF35BB|nr:hypothetical protein [Cohnella sp. OV330]SFA91364.1 hypothetical protein SAMN05216312_102204 [Cohnella sp. OV330]
MEVDQLGESEALHDIAGKLGRLEATSEAQRQAMIDLTHNVNRLVDKIAQNDKDATKALESTKSAHHRIEEMDKEIEKIRSHYDGEVRLLNLRIETESTALREKMASDAKAIQERVDTERKERKADRRWLITTVLTIAGLAVTVIKLF